MRKVKVMVGTRVETCEVVEENNMTLWVRLPDGNVIKRHKVKHVVEMMYTETAEKA